MRRIADPEAHFWTGVDRRGPDECWPWLRGQDGDGYGKSYAYGRRGRRAHLVAYELTYGAVPDGLTLDHECHNLSDCPGGPGCAHRSCCNPAHLVARSRAENVQRGHRWTGHAPTVCPHGHPLTETNVYVAPDGRRCRTCRSAARARYRARRQ